ncbi:hypothetical protein [Roseibium sp.]|uniref:hypothetical protein n=1 Tax=Roseibium sp. TaxID=1936156 RepID=UPI001B0F9854|nr:hypothetical protein [Roseibium sp.]MBO6857018.1 hypothetical protein [Roseibium sp.]
MFGNRFRAGVAVAVLAGQVVTAASVPAYAVAVPGGQSLAPADPLGLVLEELLLAQYSSSMSREPSGPSYDVDRQERDPKLSASYDLDERVTRGVIWIIQNGSNECRNSIRPEYRFDCLRNVLSRAASTIENRPNYRDAARELRSLSRKLDGIVSKYQDRSAPRAAVGQRTYRAVSTANLEQARREASEAIDESVTKLLRSAGNSEKRKTHYSQIATAVGSTKRLLRS